MMLVAHLVVILWLASEPFACAEWIVGALALLPGIGIAAAAFGLVPIAPPEDAARARLDLEDRLARLSAGRAIALVAALGLHLWIVRWLEESPQVLAHIVFAALAATPGTLLIAIRRSAR